MAQNQLTSAALTSPVTGTVASVGLSKGSTVSAGSSNDTIQVVGDGPLSVQLAIPLSAINLIKVGQSAHITVDGRTSALPARVTYVGLLNSSSSTGSSSTYTVTVELANATTGLYDGEGAQVSVDVGTASNALVVPLSALHTTGTRHTVNLYRGGTSAQTAVTVGVVGATSVQVKTGLASGQQVVLADTSEATPTSTTTSNRGAFEGGSFGTGPRGR
ncbi:efflux RND transporter periplasmic adaptor subunit [uncultured Jatrophihabitans sp.]|uniref:efflux RND transporter periplasmic adaptor subunit n=1 Tax=uncultured Jatrophihabitans sp. TaxID=1610747 RepID=UPI0035CB9498